MSDQNREIVRRFFEVWNTGDYDAIEEVLSPDVVDHDPYNPQANEGVEGAKQFIANYRQAFPDLQMYIDEQVAEGEIVATRWHATGTHTGEIMGFAPTGNASSTTGMSFDRVKDGKIVEAWSNWDTLGLMQAIGAIPGAEAGAAS